MQISQQLVIFFFCIVYSLSICCLFFTMSISLKQSNIFIPMFVYIQIQLGLNYLMLVLCGRVKMTTNRLSQCMIIFRGGNIFSKTEPCQDFLAFTNKKEYKHMVHKSLLPLIFFYITQTLRPLPQFSVFQSLPLFSPQPNQFNHT